MKFTFGEPEIKVMENNTIIYKLPWKINFGYDEGDRRIRNLMIDTLQHCVRHLKANQSGVAIGKAVVVKGDTFNYDLGVAIAESKAKQKVYKMAHKLTDALESYFESVITGLHSCMHLYLYYDEISHLQEMVDSPEEWVSNRNLVREQRKSSKK